MAQSESGRRRGARRVPTNPANLAQECAHAVMQTVPVVMRAIRTEMRRNGVPLLTIPQVRTLAYLHRSPGSCLFHLAEHLGVTRPTASTIVERLVRRGMVNRAEDPRERRRVMLRLTPLGLQHFRRTRRATQEWMAAVLSQLSAAELQRIKQGVTGLAAPFNGAVDQDSRGGRAE
jgi:DNA-binding MarR family transcriptional regulator